MPDPSIPPRPSLRTSVNSYIGACVWDTQQARLETTGGSLVVAWLNQTGTPGITATVQWEAGTTSDAGSAVQATIPSGTFDIIKNGSWDSQTGLVAYAGKNYRFELKMVSGVAEMSAYSV